MSKIAKLMYLWAIRRVGHWGAAGGFIEGTVTEETGEALSGAKAAARLSAIGFSRHAGWLPSLLMTACVAGILL